MKILLPFHCFCFGALLFAALLKLLEAAALVGWILGLCYFLFSFYLFSIGGINLASGAFYSRLVFAMLKFPLLFLLLYLTHATSQVLGLVLFFVSYLSSAMVFLKRPLSSNQDVFPPSEGNSH